jgi:hypothetical protein
MLQVCVKFGQMVLLTNMSVRQPSFTVTTEPPVISLNRMGELYSGILNKVRTGATFFTRDFSSTITFGN